MIKTIQDIRDYSTVITIQRHLNDVFPDAADAPVELAKRKKKKGKNAIKILGYVRPGKPVKEPNEDMSVLAIRGRDGETLYYEIRPGNGILYLHVGNGYYVGIQDEFTGAILLLLLAILGFFVIFSIVTKEFKNDSEENLIIPTPEISIASDDSEFINNQQKPQAEKKRIDIQGYSDFTADKDFYLGLKNPDTNENYYLQYTIYEDEDVVFETDYIRPGECVAWHVFEDLNLGKHSLTFFISTLTIDTQEPKNCAEISLEATVK